MQRIEAFVFVIKQRLFLIEERVDWSRVKRISMIIRASKR